MVSTERSAKEPKPRKQTEENEMKLEYERKKHMQTKTGHHYDIVEWIIMIMRADQFSRHSLTFCSSTTTAWIMIAVKLAGPSSISCNDPVSTEG
jgi:ABC-type cobalamin/Fe3+-siderophores transport system ATPase subunit